MKNSAKRTIKNVIMCLIIVTLCAGSYFTMDYAKNNIQSSGIEMQMPSGEMPQGFPGDSSDSESSNQPPEMPSGDSDSMPEPPSKPDGESGDSNGQPSPPSSNSSDSNSSDSNGQQPSPPSSNSSDSNSGDSSNQPPSMPNGEMPGGIPGSSKKLTTVYYVIFACESLLIALLLIFLIMSQFNKKSFKETFKGNRHSVHGKVAALHVFFDGALIVSDIEMPGIITRQDT